MSTGKNAYGICGRCGFKFRYLELRKDAYNPGIYVCAKCFDEAPPDQPNLSENIRLKHPQPDYCADTTAPTKLVDAMGFTEYFGGGT